MGGGQKYDIVDILVTIKNVIKTYDNWGLAFMDIIREQTDTTVYVNILYDSGIEVEDNIFVSHTAIQNTYYNPDTILAIAGKDLDYVIVADEYHNIIFFGRKRVEEVTEVLAEMNNWTKEEGLLFLSLNGITPTTLRDLNQGLDLDEFLR